jgi:S2P endopeptidase
MVGVIGGVAGIGGLFWAWAEVWLAVWEESRLHASWRGDKVEEAVAIVRRAMVGEVGSVTRGEALQPLVSPKGLVEGILMVQIPGVTMPFSHLPTLVLALALNQLFHEFGHALSAAM